MADKHVSEKRAIQFFKYFIQFLEIYGSENFGESAEINWFAVWSFCNSYSMWNSDDYSVNKIVYAESDEQSRDEVFKFLEEQVIDGYPIWRLFDMSDWLAEKLEIQLDNEERNKDIKYYNKTKCYRCKYYVDHMDLIAMHMGFPKIIPYEYATEKEKEIGRINHHMNCHKRLELLTEERKRVLIKDFKVDIKPDDDIDQIWNNSYSYEYSHLKKFKYARFNVEDEWGWGESMRNAEKWELNPDEFKRCPYFEEDPEMTFGRFISKYKEILRPKENNF